MVRALLLLLLLLKSPGRTEAEKKRVWTPSCSSLARGVLSESRKLRPMVIKGRPGENNRR
jgi:hypothetical protein